MKIWLIRRGTNMACSPAVMTLAMFIACVIVAYIYRKLIITTVEIAVIATASVAIAVASVALTLNTVRWYRKRAAAAAPQRQDLAIDTAAVALATGDQYSVVRVLDAKDMDQADAEADFLAAEYVDLAVDKDGKIRVRSRG